MARRSTSAIRKLRSTTLAGNLMRLAPKDVPSSSKQIVYPPTVALLPAPARVSLISPDDSESIAFLRWVEAEDPALATTTQRPPGNKAIDLPKLQHIPSYATHEPKLKGLPPTTPDLSIPTSAAIGPVRIPILSTAALAPPVAHKTSVQFSESTDALGVPAVPGVTFQASRIDAPANARFRVAVDAGAAIRSCFLIETSGGPALRAKGFSVPAAVCHLRFRVRGPHRCFAAALPALRQFERTV